MGYSSPVRYTFTTLNFPKTAFFNIHDAIFQVPLCRGRNPVAQSTYVLNGDRDTFER